MRTEVIIVGAGQAGLAMSYWLTLRSIDHVVLERGSVANSWRTERWDSLRLLTPNWLTRLPGYRYEGADPDGYMTAGEVTAYLDDYRRFFSSPVYEGVKVTSVSPSSGGFHVATSEGPWLSDAVVMATGAASSGRVPSLGRALPVGIHQLAPIEYRNPTQIGDGHVLVVGASASGVQMAAELAEDDREVTIAVGDHVRVPRRYRGRDIHYWMHASGQLDERLDDMPDPARAQRLPSLQLTGSDDARAVDLNSLRDRGVRIVGRLAGIDGSRMQFSGSLANACVSADLKMHRLLDRFDDFIADHDYADPSGPVDRPLRTRVPAAATELKLDSVTTIVWATGFAPRYPWLPERVLDRRGALRQDGGVTAVPGLYVLGLPFMRTRKSSFIDGVDGDAKALSGHLLAHLSGHASAA